MAFCGEKSPSRNEVEWEWTHNFKNVQGIINLSVSVIFGMIMEYTIFYSMQIYQSDSHRLVKSRWGGSGWEISADSASSNICGSLILKSVEEVSGEAGLNCIGSWEFRSGDPSKAFDSLK